MKVLFIAPLPPPITGHSLVSEVLYDELIKYTEVDVINLNKDTFKQGITSVKRILDIFEILMKILRRNVHADIIYLTISESFAGNVKDLFIYLFCYRNLSKMYIHLHGGSIKRLLWDQNRILYYINKFFIKRLAGVIVSGKSHLEIFDGMIESNTLHVVPNFAQDYLFLTEEDIRAKYSIAEPLRILYMSNYIPEKGFNELVDAFFALSDALKKKVRIEFAGLFESESEEKIFLGKIAGIDEIFYHGFVDDAQKKLLFSRAHIFCLPTSLFEGQPISILEAYASGCAVVTTGQRGIRDIFADGINGFEVKPRSAESIKKVLENILDRPENLVQIAIANRRIAGEKYRVNTYTNSLKKILANVGV